MMKKLSLVFAGAFGFLLGSRMGRRPYETVESKVRDLGRRPQVQSVKETISDRADGLVGAASSKVREAGSMVGEKLHVSHHDAEATSS